MVKEINIPAGQRPRKKHDLVYRQIADRIRNGEYSGKLPGVNQLAKDYGVNPLTVCKALDNLELNGMIEKRPRVGTFVKHKRRIAVLTLEKDHTGSHNFSGSTVFDKIVRGIQKAMERYKMPLLFHSASPADIDFINNLKRDVDGLVIITSLEVTEQDLDIFHDIPWVKAMGDYRAIVPSSHVTYNNDLIGRLAADFLTEQNCERFFYYGYAGQDSPVFCSRWEIFKARLEANGYTACNLYPQTARTTEEIVNGARELLQQHQIGTDYNSGIFVPADRDAITLYQILYSLGLTPCEDVKIISCDNNDLHLQGLYPRPPTIDIRMEDIGERAAEMLLKMTSVRDSKLHEKVILTPELANQIYKIRHFAEVG